MRVRKDISYPIVIGNGLLVILVHKLKDSYNFLGGPIRTRTINRPNDVIVHTLCSTSKIVYVRMESLILIRALAYLSFICAVNVARHSEIRGNLHCYHIMNGLDIIVILIHALVILKDFVIKSVHERKQLLGLLISQQYTDRFKPKENRKECPHVLKELTERSLCTDHSGQFDGLQHLHSCYGIIWLSCHFIKFSLDELNDH